MKRVTWDDLNALAVRIHDLPQGGNDAVRMALSEELAIGLYEIFDYRFDRMADGDHPVSFKQDVSMEALAEFWISGWPAFDPSKGTFQHFFFMKRKKIWSDIYRSEERDEKRDQSKQQEPKEEGDPKTSWKKRNISLYTPLSDEESGYLLDLQGDPNSDVSAGTEETAAIQSFLALSLTISARLHGRKNTKARQAFFRLFFTDGLAAALRTFADQTPFLEREQDLLDASEASFLDFFLSTVCRTVPEIADGQLKLYGEMVPGRPMEELEPEGKTKWHLPNDVYTTYREKQGESCLPSSVSTYWTEYRKHCRTLLDELYDQA